MKKILLFFALLISASLFASSFEHVQKDCSYLSVSQNAIPCLLSDWFHLDEHVSFVESRVVTDQMGMSHISLQQYVDGVPVKGGLILVHCQPNGLVKSINGDLLRVEASCLSQQDAYGRKALRARYSAPADKQYPIVWVSCVMDGLNTTRKAYKVDLDSEYKTIYVDVTTGEVLKEESHINSISGTAYTVYSGWQNIEYANNNGVNVLFDETRNIETVDASHLVLNEEGFFDLSSLFYFTNPDSRWATQYLKSITLSTADDDWWSNSLTDIKGDFYIKIKSLSGEVLYTSSYITDKNPPITFTIPTNITITVAAGIKIEIWDHDGVTEGGIDDEGGSVTVTQTTAGTYTWSNSKTTGSYVIDELPHPAYDVHWGMERVWDYYLATFNHRGFNGNNGPVIQLVNPPSSIPIFSNAGYPYNASAFGGTGMFAYGYGGSEHGWSYVVAIDVMGHEFTHAVTGANGNQNLPIYGEGGALNESFGDIMGNAVEKFAKGDCDWLVGAEVTNNGLGLRSMKNPSSSYYNHPKTYLTSPNWKNITGNPTGGADGNDMDGVHTNCGVQNYWFYLLCQGGSGTNDNGETYNITGIGMDKAIQIVYRNLLYYITSESEYPQSRVGSINAAQDLLDNHLFGMTAADVQTVKDAWDAVGVYETEPIVPDCKTLPYSESFASDQGEFTIEDVALDGLNYVWKFASGYGMKASAYVNSVYHPTESWLISPCLEFPEESAITLTFDHVYRYTSAPTSELTLLVSEDYESGAPSAATWTPVAIPTYSSGSNWTFVNSGNINLNAYAGKYVTLAFRYKSSSAAAATWEIKNVSVTSSPLATGIESVLNQNNATKCIIDGHLFILRDGHKYTATGTMVE